MADLISLHCEAMNKFHPGQYGGRPQRSALDAVGVVMAQAQEAWKRGKVVGALMMDVAVAFPSVARGCLLRMLSATEVDKNLVDWVNSFMKERKVVMSVDGQEGEAKEVETGLPQGSPVSPVLFTVYMADIHGEVDAQVEGCRGISFVDDITWVVEGEDLRDLTTKLGECADNSLRWAEKNAVCFETSKTEAVLLTKRKELWRKARDRPIQAGDRQVYFAKGATRWLGVWLDSALSLKENRGRCVN